MLMQPAEEEASRSLIEEIPRPKINRGSRMPGLEILVIFVGLQVLCVAGGLCFPQQFRYLSTANIRILLRSIPQTAVVALGTGILMIGGEFDLSVGAVFTLSSIV